MCVGVRNGLHFAIVKICIQIIKDAPRNYMVARSVFKKFEVRSLFAGDDSFAGANRSASATVDAGVGVDVVDVTFRDSANGAFGEAGAASDTFVGNYVSHSSQF